MNEAQALSYFQSLLPETYTLSKLLAEGGFAQTFLATRGTKQTACVVKVLSMQRVDDWKSIELFEREAKLLKHLDHTNIPDFYDSFSIQENTKNYFFLVQEFLEGRSLEEKIADGKRFNEAETLKIAQQLIQVLIYLHSFSPPIIHRDIKPSNIMINDQNQVWLIDFGAVRDTVLRQGERGSTIVGTFGYMPLEQFEGRAQAASDIYALGMSLIFALSGKEPSKMEKKGLKTHFRPYINSSSALSRILERMIEPDLQKRYRSAEEVKQDLKKLTQPKASVQHHLNQVTHTLKNHPFRKKQLQGLGLTGLVLFGGYWLLHRNQRPGKISATQVPIAHTESIKANTGFPRPWHLNADEGAKDVTQQAWAQSALWQLEYYKVFRIKDHKIIYWHLKDIMGSENYQIGHMLGNEDELYLISKSDQPGIVNFQNNEWQRLTPPEHEKITAATLLNRDLLIAQKNKLWRYRYQTKTWELWAETPKEQYNSDIHALAAQTDPETVWISANQQVWQLKNGQLNSIWKSKQTLEHLLIGRDGHLWMGSNKGLFEYKPELNSVSPHLPLEDIQTLSLDQTQNLWVGTRERGLFYEQDGHWQNQSWTDGLPTERVQSVLVDPQNQVWLALDNEKVHLAPKAELLKNWHERKMIEQIPYTRYANACEAVQHELRNGEVRGDIARVDYSGKVHAFVRGNQVCPAGSDYLAKDGSLYTSSYKGIIKTQHGSPQNIGKPTAKYATISKMFGDSQKRLWVNGYGFGLSFYHQGKWHKVAGKEMGLVSIYENKQGEILLGKKIGGTDMLHIYQADKLTSVPLGDKSYMRLESFDSESPDSISIQIASTEGLWSGTPNHWRLLTKEQGLPFDNLDTLRIAQHKTWLLGGRGLAWVNLDRTGQLPQDVTPWNAGWLTSRSGLFADQLDEIAMDGHKNLWLINDRDKLAIYQISDLEARHATLQKNKQRKPDS